MEAKRSPKKKVSKLRIKQNDVFGILFLIWLFSVVIIVIYLATYKPNICRYTMGFRMPILSCSCGSDTACGFLYSLYWFLGIVALFVAVIGIIYGIIRKVRKKKPKQS